MLETAGSVLHVRNNKLMVKKVLKIIFIISLIFSVFTGCRSAATSAEEYFSIGMAYFELGRYDEAERWLNRARSADRTMTASQYNLGRLAFERQRYSEAAGHFEDILNRDPNNVLALRAAAYTRIRTGDIDIADRHYSRLLTLVPESADDGYNHALVLYAMERYGDAEKVLERYPLSLQDKQENLLLYARSQKAQNKIEAINSYTSWLNTNNDVRVRFEYAEVLEHHELYARALEEYRKTLSETPSSSSNPKRSDIHFALARVLLVADSASNEGITELQRAVNDGFDDISAVEDLFNNTRVSAANRDLIRNILADMLHQAQ